MTQSSKYKDYIGFLSDDMNPKDYYSCSPSILFKEVAPKYTDGALYTMDDRDRFGLLSARRIYMTSTSEYEAAMRLVGSWQGWLKLCKLGYFMNGEKGKSWGGLLEWREEMKIRDQALAKTQLMKSARGGNVSAQRAIYETRNAKSKRPVKDDTEAAGNKIVAEASERIRLIKK